MNLPVTVRYESFSKSFLFSFLIELIISLLVLELILKVNIKSSKIYDLITFQRLSSSIVFTTKVLDSDYSELTNQLLAKSQNYSFQM